MGDFSLPTLFSSGTPVTNGFASLNLHSSWQQAVAEESVLQMVTRPALTALNDFITSPSTHNASCLMDIPSLYDLLQYEHIVRKGYSEALIQVCNWIHKRGRSVLDQLLVHAVPVSPPVQNDVQSEDLWSKVTFFCFLLIALTR
jgi:hypothetical protein